MTTLTASVIKRGMADGTYVSLIDSAQWSSDLPPKIEIVGDCARWTAVRRDQLPPVADPFIEG
jgi:hypothetical protein